MRFRPLRCNMSLTFLNFIKLIMVIACVGLVISIFQVSRLSPPLYEHSGLNQAVSRTKNLQDKGIIIDQRKLVLDDRLVRTKEPTMAIAQDDDNSNEVLSRIVEDLQREDQIEVQHENGARITRPPTAVPRVTTESVAVLEDTTAPIESVVVLDDEVSTERTPMVTNDDTQSNIMYEEKMTTLSVDSDEEGLSSNEEDAVEMTGSPVDDVMPTDKIEDDAVLITTRNPSEGGFGVEEVEVTPPPAKNEDTVTSEIEKPVHILLLTEGRSGSTWLSSFFWHRKDVFYVFEPLYATPKWKEYGCSTNEEMRSECSQMILGGLWDCKFQSDDLSILGRYPNYRQWCDRCPIEKKEEICRTKPYRVAKTINLFDLESIADLIKDTEKYDIRVIQLVRDPRPLLNSRSKGGFGSIDGIHNLKDHSEVNDTESREAANSVESQYETVCKRMLNNAILGDNPPDWLKNRYVRISHEKMSLHPIETAKILYDFVDMEWNEHTEQYIRNTTTGDEGLGGMFGIGRVSTEVVDKWKSMPSDLIETITRACFSTIEYLGYETNLDLIEQWKIDNANLYNDIIESEGKS